MRELEQKYGGVDVDMSDEAVLARAQAIQQALLNKKRNEIPNIKWLQVPSSEFRAPPSTIPETYLFLATFPDRELLREWVILETEIGSGKFGSVWSGFVNAPGINKRPIAVKTLKDSFDNESRLLFLQEACVLMQFRHPKIVGVVGVLTKTEPILVCMDLMELGSLRSYLRSDAVSGKLTDLEFIRMACDVCSAMHYLGESGFIHRNLAARNVLINKGLVCKVSDFGKGLEAGVMNSSNDGIPVRWTAPEANEHSLFSTASDVWSFGVLLWEMWSYGEIPYKEWDDEKVKEQVGEGYRYAVLV